MENKILKEEVRKYWNARACNSNFSSAKKFSREYFDQIEARRYATEPEILEFADFKSARNKKVLEVGIGAATDFLQWVRSGAEAYGIDLTEEAIEHAKQRLECYGLQAKEIRVADAENLPYENDFFDLVYSWGVVHHTPDTQKALSEIVRVTRPGGEIKIMLYNRRSLHAYYEYLIHGLLKGKPFRKISDILYHHQESLGTKAYTLGEVRKMFEAHPIQDLNIQARLTYYDLLRHRSWPFQAFARLIAALLPVSWTGYFVVISALKK